MRIRPWTVLGVVALAAGCASTKVTDSWTDPSFTGTAPQKVLVVSLVPSNATRAQLEQQLSAELGKEGLTAEPATQYLPAGQKVTAEQVRTVAREHRFDGVVVTRFGGIREQVDYVGGPVAMDDYMGVYGPVVYEPGYYDETEVMTMYTDLFDVDGGSGKLIWSATTETFDPNSIQKEIPGLAEKFANRLEKDLLG